MEEPLPPAGGARNVARRLTTKLRREIGARLSPEHTRAATLSERLTVSRLSWELIVRLNRYLEFFGKITTVIYAAFVVTVVFGVDWRQLVETTFNWGAPVRGAVSLVIVLVTLLFVALHSLIGYARWKLQRELWRRDVTRLRALEERLESS